MLKYEIYDIDGDDYKFNRIVELDVNDIEGMRGLKKIDKQLEFTVRPVDDDSVFHWAKPQRRGNSVLGDNHIVDIFTWRAKENLSSFEIGSKLYKEHDIIVSRETIDKVLARKSHKDVVIANEILEKIARSKVVRKKRTPVTPEDRAKILKLYDNGNGLSGRAIAALPEFDYSDATINKVIRKEFGYRK